MRRVVLGGWVACEEGGVRWVACEEGGVRRVGGV